MKKFIVIMLAFSFISITTYSYSKSIPGCVSGNCKNGKGILVTPEKLYYQGSFKNYVMHGYGELVKGDKVIYRGNFKRGKKSGKGAYFYDSGDYYIGLWKHNKKHGKGQYYIKDMDIMCKGTWKNNILYNGYGRKLFENGDYYLGYFKKGKMSGHGSYIRFEKGMFTGQFKDNLPVGCGVMHSKDAELLGKACWNGEEFIIEEE